MPSHLTTAPDPAPQDPHDGLPDAWSDSAKETYVQIEAENPHLGAVELASLYEACSLLALADDMAAQVAEDGLTVPGSQGQPAAHPLLSEIRLGRASALAALRALGIARNQSPASAAGAALAARRHHSRTAGVRAGR